jgi:uncharacterized small protein (DUF1192 family)
VLELWPGWTITGFASTALAVLLALWKRTASAPTGSDSWATRLLRNLSALYRLQIAEGDLDRAKASILLSESLIANRDRAIADLMSEIEYLRGELLKKTSSRTTPSSDASSVGSTGRRGVKTPKKPTS